MQNIENIIRKLDLQPHPEGGYFKEVYRSKTEIPGQVLGENFHGSRNCSTSIYFLLTSENFSAFHRIKQDEIWHFYMGSAIDLHVISERGDHKKYVIGNDLEADELLQFVVPAGDWFAAEVTKPDSFALVGCTVSPGFSFDDFELPSRQELLNKFPHHEKLITKFTHS